MAKWLMTLAFVVLVAQSSFGQKGRKEEEECFGSGGERKAFNCSKPILSVNDTREHLKVYFRNASDKNIFGLGMAWGKGFLNVTTIISPEKSFENPKFRPSVSKFRVKMNISRSNVYLRDPGEKKWHKMDIRETDQISFFYIDDYPDFCIKCGGVDIWHNNHSTGQLLTSTTVSTEDATERVAFLGLCLFLAAVIFLISYDRVMKKKEGERKAEVEEYDAENDAYIPADVMHGHENDNSKRESQNDMSVSADAPEDENAYEIVD